MTISRYVLPINPEPWAVGSVSAGRRGGKIKGTISPNPNLVAFQQAVREELDGVDMLPHGEYKLTFYFWRELTSYLDAGDRRRSRNQADATNLQKGLEDALQGVLFENDRNVRVIQSIIVEQGPWAKPCILIEAERIENLIQPDFPASVWEEVYRAQNPEIKPAKNVWPPPGRF